MNIIVESRNYVLFITTALLTFFGCSNSKENANISDEKGVMTQTEPDYMVALNFLNDYNVSAQGDGDVKQWLKLRDDVTTNFIQSLEKIIDEADAEDPVYGLGFDPILVSQDGPAKFIIRDTDDSYVRLEGFQYSDDYYVTVKLVKDQGSWKIDGAGIVNIPETRQWN